MFYSSKIGGKVFSLKLALSTLYGQRSVATNPCSIHLRFEARYFLRSLPYLPSKDSDPWRPIHVLFISDWRQGIFSEACPIYPLKTVIRGDQSMFYSSQIGGKVFSQKLALSALYRQRSVATNPCSIHLRLEARYFLRSWPYLPYTDSGLWRPIHVQFI